MGAVNTTYTFTPTDTITSTKMNNIIDETVMTADAVLGGSGGSGGLDISDGRLSISSNAINSSRLAAGAVTTAAITDASVTEAKLAVGAKVPSGAIMAFAMNSAPTGWVAANGASVSTTTYAALFAAIGYTYGGSGGSFNLPDLRGYFVRGFGTNVDGTTSNSSFGEKKADTLQNITGTAGRFQSSFAGTTSSGVFTLSAGTYTVGGGGSGAYQTVNFDASRVARTSTETAPRNISLLYCIKL
jgi:microcystin-dependent protein